MAEVWEKERSLPYGYAWKVPHLPSLRTFLLGPVGCSIWVSAGSAARFFSSLQFSLSLQTDHRATRPFHWATRSFPSLPPHYHGKQRGPERVFSTLGIRIM